MRTLIDLPFMLAVAVAWAQAAPLVEARASVLLTAATR